MKESTDGGVVGSGDSLGPSALGGLVSAFLGIFALDAVGEGSRRSCCTCRRR